MPPRSDLESILVLGSGPIVIGQACEFDYSGTQAARVLRAAGYRVVLANSNPATIMTDPDIADATYVEPLVPDVIEAIVDRERPDAVLATLGGQTALNLAVELERRGAFEKFGVEVIGAPVRSIEIAENRSTFKEVMQQAGLTCPRSGHARTVDEAEAVASEVGFPVMVRPSFILGGGGTGIAADLGELRALATTALRHSPVGEILVEESVAGWKEFELEVMRDSADNAVIVCSIENIDPMGVHTGDSMTVAPAQTLSDREYQEMRDEAIACLRAVGVDTGGSNVQFAVDPATGRRLIIEMNPRVSRSSALASKATGFPIAKIAALLAVGATLDEIANDITRATPASFEPALDYVVVKLPRFDFAKFPSQHSALGSVMRSVGEVMAIGRTFPEALQKGLRSLDTGRLGLNADPAEAVLRELPDAVLLERAALPTPDRLYAIAEALRRGRAVESLVAASRIDGWFIHQMADIVDMRRLVEASPGDTSLLRPAKRLGFSDAQIAHLWETTGDKIEAMRLESGPRVTFKTVDTCAGEFPAATPYFYSAYEDEDEGAPLGEQTVIVLGSGPNRIGQGIEFDYCCVHASFALRDAGYEPVMVNCNPETVSTDYDTSTRLYFEPLTLEDVMAVVRKERPRAVIVQLGGQTPLRLAGPLAARGVAIAGTAPEAIDTAEDREKFAALCRRVGAPQPSNGVARSLLEATEVAERIGYPVLVRPSYVLGGRAMKIVYDHDHLTAHLRDLYGSESRGEIDLSAQPLLVDRFLEAATELDIDVLFDGSTLLVGGIMEHIHEAGIHSGDSACVVPPPTLSPAAREQVLRHTDALARALDVRGLLNIQCAVRGSEVFVLEANPRASRTVPFISKATGVPLAKLATLVMMGATLSDLDLAPSNGGSRFVAVKEAVVPWQRFPEEDTVLGPEMRSTGEVMGLATDLGAAYAKALLAAGTELRAEGTVFISLADKDKRHGYEVARRFAELGFRLLATKGTAALLASAGIAVSHVDKVGEGAWDPVRLLEEGKIDLVVNTPQGRRARGDGRRIRLAARRRGVPCVTSLPGAMAVALAVGSGLDRAASVRPLQEYHRWT